ncbi:MAG: hypothetical protein PHG95_04035 [Patescibacteria group bacterium]|nr:hypothetical protein [Patescibacteria group bacterium]
MPLISAAFLPPSPLLIPEIGKQNNQMLQKTSQAYRQMAAIFEKEEIEIIIVISPYGLSQNENISLNIAPQLQISFQEFGYLATIKALNPAWRLADNIVKEMSHDNPVKLSSQEKLDYGSAVPLALLTENIKINKTLPLFPADQKDRAYHYEFGLKLGEILKKRPEKIALVASGELSRRLKKNSPGGYSPKGVRFDNRVIEYLNDSENGLNKLLALEERMGEEAMEGGLKQLSLLIGAIGENCQAQILAYQNDFGIGYLSVNFNLQVATI